MLERGVVEVVEVCGGENDVVCWVALGVGERR